MRQASPVSLNIYRLFCLDLHSIATYGILFLLLQEEIATDLQGTVVLGPFASPPYVLCKDLREVLVEYHTSAVRVPAPKWTATTSATQRRMWITRLFQDMQGRIKIFWILIIPRQEGRKARSWPIVQFERDDVRTTAGLQPNKGGWSCAAALRCIDSHCSIPYVRHAFVW